MDCFQFLNCSLLKTTFEESSDVSFRVFHVNIRSIRKYWDQFMVVVRDLGKIMDVFILTEVNINEEMTILFSIPGYDRFALTRTSGRGGGYVCLSKTFGTQVRLQ